MTEQGIKISFHQDIDNDVVEAHADNILTFIKNLVPKSAKLEVTAGNEGFNIVPEKGRVKYTFNQRYTSKGEMHFGDNHVTIESSQSKYHFYEQKPKNQGSLAI